MERGSFIVLLIICIILSMILLIFCTLKIEKNTEKKVQYTQYNEYFVLYSNPAPVQNTDTVIYYPHQSSTYTCEGVCRTSRNHCHH